MSAIQSLPSTPSEQRPGALQHLKDVQGELIRELELHDLEIHKMELARQVAQTEWEYYDAMMAETQLATSHIQEEIQDLKRELKASLNLKKNIQEYDHLAQMAQQTTSLRENQQVMNEVTNEMEKLRDTVQASQEVLELRGGQFQLLLQTIADLQQNVKEEDLIEMASSSS